MPGGLLQLQLHRVPDLGFPMCRATRVVIGVRRGQLVEDREVEVP